MEWSVVSCVPLCRCLWDLSGINTNLPAALPRTGRSLPAGMYSSVAYSAATPWVSMYVPPIALGSTPPRSHSPAQPLAGYPPLPPACSGGTSKWFKARRRQQERASKAAPRSPFAGWSLNKAFTFPYNAHGAHSEAESCVLEIVQWGAGLCENLSFQLQSEVGLDPFNYTVRRRIPPCLRMRSNLKAALVHWALNWPEALLFHLFHESVGSVLGGAFPWAVFGNAKTLWRHPDQSPW